MIPPSIQEAVILPSLREMESSDFMLILNSYLSCGTPVLCFNYSGTPVERTPLEQQFCHLLQGVPNSGASSIFLVGRAVEHNVAMF